MSKYKRNRFARVKGSDCVFWPLRIPKSIRIFSTGNFSSLLVKISLFLKNFEVNIISKVKKKEKTEPFHKTSVYRLQSSAIHPKCSMLGFECFSVSTIERSPDIRNFLATQFASMHDGTLKWRRKKRTEKKTEKMCLLARWWWACRNKKKKRKENEKEERCERLSNECF